MKAILLTAILLLCACSEPVSYIQENVSLPPPAPRSTVCRIGETEFYQASYFLYHVNTLGTREVYSPVGTYSRPEGYPRWQLKLYKDRNDSIYNKTMGYISARMLPNGELVICNRTQALPSEFTVFIQDHEALYKGKFRLPDDGFEI